MPLISSIEIENFRCFKKLSVSGLTRVNLIVGGNNSGKTALLEAIQLAVDKGYGETILEHLRRRDEYAAIEGMSGPDLSSLFYGVPQRLLDGNRLSVTLEYKTGLPEVVSGIVISAPDKLELRFTAGSSKDSRKGTSPVNEITIQGNRPRPSFPGWEGRRKTTDRMPPSRPGKGDRGLGFATATTLWDAIPMLQVCRSAL